MSRPSTLSPEGKETDTVAVAALVVAAVMRRLRAPPVTQVVCSVLGSGILAAIPFRSPVGEWQLLHFVAKYAWPALASPTRILGASFPTDGGLPWDPIMSTTLRMYAATANPSWGLMEMAGMPESWRLPWMTGRISSPF